jgi:hypothetical protein
MFGGAGMDGGVVEGLAGRFRAGGGGRGRVGSWSGRRRWAVRQGGIVIRVPAVGGGTGLDRGLGADGGAGGRVGSWSGRRRWCRRKGWIVVWAPMVVPEEGLDRGPGADGGGRGRVGSWSGRRRWCRRQGWIVVRAPTVVVEAGLDRGPGADGGGRGRVGLRDFDAGRVTREALRRCCAGSPQDGTRGARERATTADRMGSSAERFWHGFAEGRPW